MESFLELSSLDAYKKERTNISKLRFSKTICNSQQTRSSEILFTHNYIIENSKIRNFLGSSLFCKANFHNVIAA